MARFFRRPTVVVSNKQSHFLSCLLPLFAAIGCRDKGKRLPPAAEVVEASNANVDVTRDYDEAFRHAQDHQALSTSSASLHQIFVNRFCSNLRQSPNESFKTIESCRINFTYSPDITTVASATATTTATTSATQDTTANDRNTIVGWPWSPKKGGKGQGDDADITGFVGGELYLSHVLPSTASLVTDVAAIGKAILEAYNEVHVGTPYSMNSFDLERIIEVPEDVDDIDEQDDDDFDDQDDDANDDSGPEHDEEAIVAILRKNKKDRDNNDRRDRDRKDRDRKDRDKDDKRGMVSRGFWTGGYSCNHCGGRRNRDDDDFLYAADSSNSAGGSLALSDGDDESAIESSFRRLFNERQAAFEGLVLRKLKQSGIPEYRDLHECKIRFSYGDDDPGPFYVSFESPTSPAAAVAAGSSGVVSLE